MRNSPSSPRPTGRWLIGISLAVLLAVGFLAAPQLQIAYHRWQLERGRANMYGDEAGLGAGELLWVEKYQGNYGDPAHFDYHRDRLTKLGSIRHKTYRLQNIQSPSDESSHLFRSLYEQPSVDWTSPSPDGPHPIVIDVWTEWSDAAAWDAFIAERDVPDYRGRYMKDE